MLYGKYKKIILISVILILLLLILSIIDPFNSVAMVRCNPHSYSMNLGLNEKDVYYNFYCKCIGFPKEVDYRPIDGDLIQSCRGIQVTWCRKSRGNPLPNGTLLKEKCFDYKRNIIG